MRLLITGGAGFVGHHIVEHLLKFTDWDIVSLDRLDTAGTLVRISDMGIFEQCRKRITIVHHDLKAEINDLVAKMIGPVDIILHVAAASHVDRSIEDPLSFAMDNVVGTVNLLNFSRTRFPNAKFLYFSTDEVFGPAIEGYDFKDNDRYNSGNPYAASKAGGEEFCVAFANTYRMKMLITHCMNIFGERQHPEKFIPKVIGKVLRGETVTIHADDTKTVSGTRHYIHARNVASAILFLLTKADIKTGTAEKFNIMGEKEVSNLQLAKDIASLINLPLKYEMSDFYSSRPGHDFKYSLDGTKIKNLGWSVPMAFERSLESTVKWTVARKDKWLI